MKECKFKVGDKVIYISDNPRGDSYEHNTIYTVKKVIKSGADCDYLIETKESDTAARWQWKFELAKSQIVKQIIQDLL